MPRLLFAWLGHTDLRAAAGRIEGLGPIAGALRDRDFDRVVLLSSQPRAEERAYLRWLRHEVLEGAEVPVIELDRRPLKDPTDFGAIHAAATVAIDARLTESGGDARLTFHLSPGTPAMAAVWILLARTRYAADLLQSSPEAGVEDVVIPFEISAEFLPDLVRGPDRRLQALTAGLPPQPRELSDIIHRSPQIRRLIALSRRIAVRDVPVLIQGETGTGKELLAHGIHRASLRAERPFLVLNCAAIPGELMEAELFGHEKGAFTGADRPRAGYFEEASGGTLFLDEVGELPRGAQAKLLRALQEGEVTRVGARKPVAVDVRILAATHRDLLADVANGLFREDLFHRLAVGLLSVPPLREREGDVGLLIDVFLARIAEQTRDQPGPTPERITPAARNLLLGQRWPGNVRELQNTLLRACTWATGEAIGVDDVRNALLPHPALEGSGLLGRPLGERLSLPSLIAELSRHYLERALEATGGNKTRAAELVGLPSYQTFTNWMKRYGVEE